MKSKFTDPENALGVVSAPISQKPKNEASFCPSADLGGASANTGYKVLKQSKPTVNSPDSLNKAADA